MPGRKQRTNKFLALAAVLLSLGCGSLLTQSSAAPSPLDSKQMPDMFVARNMDDSTIQSEGTVAEEIQEEEQDVSVSEAEPTVTSTPEPTPTPVPRVTPFEASQEAASGIWTPSGSNWCFMVNGTPYTGWLTDTDGRRYYFDANGIMQTGWLDDNGKQYYLNADGIMQIGNVTIDGQIYSFGADGSLESGPVPASENTNSGSVFAYISSGPSEEENTIEVPKSETGTATPVAETPAAEVPAEETPADAIPAEETQAADAPTDEVPAEETQAPRKKVALTFDDGPSDFTDRLLDCLEANHAKATFFLVGMEILNFPEPLSRMEALGCEIGNHSYDHTDLTTLSAEEITSQLAKTDQEITNLTGHAATLIRPPYGSINDTVRSTVDRPMILWSVDTLDWETEDASRTVQNVLDHVQDGSIILMHDIYKASVDAAEILIPKLIELGYDLVTVHELAADKGAELSPGISYGEFTQ